MIKSKAVKNKPVKQKQQKFTERIKAWTIFFLGLFVLLFVLLVVTDNKSYCQTNPDKCIFEPTPLFLDNSKNSYFQPIGITHQEWCANYYIKVLSDYSGNKSIIKELCQIRKKTMAELDIDDCNSNPREDALCKCEEGYNFKITSPESCIIEEQHINCKKINDHNITCFWEKPIICTDFSDYLNKNTTINKCLKSRPKTECEKGNPEWVYNMEVCIYDESTLTNMTQEEIEIGKKYAKSKGIPLCTSIQTICREVS